MAAAGILSSNTSAAQAMTGTTAKADTDNSSTSSDSAPISSSDFLTLLVTELKNQDPTASTDPNEYVNQLVSVNSLEQLININSTLTTDLGSSSGTTSSVAKASAASLTGSSATPQSNASSGGTSVPSDLQTATSKLAPGNLSVPSANSSAQAVAQALSGQRKSL
jgi:flagellar basal-body rod modification protein FlgD